MGLARFNSGQVLRCENPKIALYFKMLQRSSGRFPAPPKGTIATAGITY
jgi:hypothetical protein